MESWMLSWKEIWAAGWAGDTQDIWYGRTNLKFVQNFTETENNNLQMFPQMKNSVTCGQWTICSIKFRKAVQLKPIKSDKAKICSIKQSLANLPFVFLYFWIVFDKYEVVCAWFRGTATLLLELLFLLIPILSDRKQGLPCLGPDPCNDNDDQPTIFSTLGHLWIDLQKNEAEWR